MGISRVDDMIEEQNRTRSNQKDSDSVVVLLGKYVSIMPKYGNIPIIGIFVGEKRPFEYTRENCLVVQTSEGVTSFIRREDIAYITLLESGIVQEPDRLDEYSFVCERGFEIKR